MMMPAWGRNYGRSPKCRSDRVADAGYRVKCEKPLGHRGEHRGTLPLWPALKNLGMTEPQTFTWGAEPRSPLRKENR